MLPRPKHRFLIHIRCKGDPEEKTVNSAKIKSRKALILVGVRNKNSSVVIASQCGSLGSLVLRRKSSVHFHGILS